MSLGVTILLTLGLFVLLSVTFGIAIRYAKRTGVGPGVDFITGGIFVRETMFIIQPPNPDRAVPGVAGDALAPLPIQVHEKHAP